VIDILKLIVQSHSFVTKKVPLDAFSIVPTIKKYSEIERREVFKMLSNYTLPFEIL